MTATVYFLGKKITQRERAILSACFDETIDDMPLCNAILIRAMRPENALMRGALARALKTGRCKYEEGGRLVKKLIRVTRRQMGYRDSLSDQAMTAIFYLRHVPYGQIAKTAAHGFGVIVMFVVRQFHDPGRMF